MEFGAISQCSANISKCIFIGKQSCSHGFPIGIHEINAGFNFIFGQCWTNQIAQSLFDGGNFVRGLQVLPQSSDSLFTFITSELAKEKIREQKIIIYSGRGNIRCDVYWLVFFKDNLGHWFKKTFQKNGPVYFIVNRSYFSKANFLPIGQGQNGYKDHSVLHDVRCLNKWEWDTRGLTFYMSKLS